MEAVNFQTFHAMLQCSLFGEGRAYNAIFLAGAAGDEFASLTDLQIEKYADYYRGEVVLSVPLGPKTQKKEKHEHER